MLAMNFYKILDSFQEEDLFKDYFNKTAPETDEDMFWGIAHR